MSKKLHLKKHEDNEVVLSSVAESEAQEEKINVDTNEKKGDKEVASSNEERLTPENEKAEYAEPKHEEKNVIYAIDAIQYGIKTANQHKNYHLASELHKIDILLSDINHVFNHLSGEAKLICNIALKRGQVLKC